MQPDRYASLIENSQLQTEIFKVDPIQPELQRLEPAARALREGCLVVFPTETVYGLGADALNESAVSHIFLAKGRPADNPLIVHLSDPADLHTVVQTVSPLALQLMEAFAPGPLTLVMRKADSVGAGVTAGLDTVAVRIPAHPVARSLIRLAGIPVAAPSANRSGRPSPTRAWHVQDDLWGRVSYIIDAGQSVLGLESTVLDISRGQPVILRPGSITIKQINQVVQPLGYLCQISGEKPEDDAETPARSPGMKYRHYAPAARVLPVCAQDKQKLPALIVENLTRAEKQGLHAGIFSCRQSLSRLPEQRQIQIAQGRFTSDESGLARTGSSIKRPDQRIPVFVYAEQQDAIAAGSALYDALRMLDLYGVDIIIAEGIDGQPEADAYMNRLLKAAGQL